MLKDPLPPIHALVFLLYVKPYYLRVFRAFLIAVYVDLACCMVFMVCVSSCVCFAGPNVPGHVQ